MCRYIGLDVHKHLIVARGVNEAGKPVFAGRLESICAVSLEVWAQANLHADDRLVLEATTNSWAVARGLRPFVAEVAVANPLKVKIIAEAKIKTDKVDAKGDHLLDSWLHSDPAISAGVPSVDERIPTTVAKSVRVHARRIPSKHRVNPTGTTPLAFSRNAIAKTVHDTCR